MEVYVVMNGGLTPTSSYNEIILITENIKSAETCLETFKNDTIRQMDKGEYEGFKGEYILEFDDNVNHLYTKSDKQVCFSNDEGYYDICWIEKHEVVK